MSANPPVYECPPSISMRLTGGEIDRAGNELCENRDNLKAIRSIEAYRKFRANCLKTSLSILEASELPENCIVSARLKRMQSIHRKLVRSGGQNILRNMDDIVGFRVVCETYDAACELSNRIASLPAHHNCKPYLNPEDHPRKMGYRAFHHIMRFGQHAEDHTMWVRFEVQIRTYYQHRWAICCESLGDQAKEGFAGRIDNLTEKSRQIFQKVSREISTIERSAPSRVQGGGLQKLGKVLNLAVVWHPENMPVRNLLFHDNIQDTVDFLHYLESRHPRIQDILLLAGVSSDDDLIPLLQKTHPGFVPPSQFDWAPKKLDASHIKKAIFLKNPK